MPKFRTSDGLNLYYEDDGPEGPPLLCLPGLTRNARDFDLFAPHAKRLRLIRLDSRGRGQSDYDPDYTNYNVLREAGDVVELLDHLNLSKISILGTSRGGLIAMLLASSHAERLAAVVLNDVGPVIGAAGIARIMGYVGKPPSARSYDEAAATLQGVMAAEFPGVAFEVWRAQAEAQYRFDEATNRLHLRYDANIGTALREQAAANAAPDLWPLFDALRAIPCGVLRGANSSVLEADTLSKMQARNANLLVAEVPDRGHVPFLNETEALELIDTVLEQVA